MAEQNNFQSNQVSQGTQNFKRNVAFKHRIGDLLRGKPIFNGEKFIYLELGNKNIVRINIVANVVDKYDSEPVEGKTRFSSITLDDGTGQIKARVFADDIKLLDSIVQGNTLLIIGNLRNFNNELYLQPEIVRVTIPEYLLVRKLEVEKEQIKLNNNMPTTPEKREESKILKDTILVLIKESEKEGGIDIDKIIMQLKDSPPEIINQEIQRYIEDGIVFEPRPGKVRFLG
jgi:RecG-like helicase